MENNLTSKEAISNAVRLLEQAEMELDLAKMERLEGLSVVWLALAELLVEVDRV